MQGIVILVFEILMIILYGIFIRTDSSTTSSVSNLDSGLFFIAGTLHLTTAYTFLTSRSRHLDWTILTHYLFTIMLCFQINTLYYYFWLYAFSQNFSSTSSLSAPVFVSGLEATLTVLVTISGFVSRLSQLGIFVVVMIEVFFFAINWGICRWGIGAITGGGAMNVWMFGMVFAACIRKFRYPDLKETNNARYFTKTLQLISLVILVITWPSFNLLASTLDLTVPNLDPSSLLSQNSYFQTWLCLFSCIVTSLSLRITGQRISLDKIIPSIINTGILISSSACVIIDPFASILIGIIGPILYYVYDRFGGAVKDSGYPVDGVVMGVIGGLMSAIFCGGRNGRSPGLSADAVRQGGLQFAALLVSLIFSIIFGILTALLLKLITKDDIQLTDMGIWQIESDMLPLYPDDPKLAKLYKIQDKQRLQQENLGFSLRDRYLSSNGLDKPAFGNTSQKDRKREREREREREKEKEKEKEKGKILKEEVEISSKVMGDGRSQQIQ